MLSLLAWQIALHWPLNQTLMTMFVYDHHKSCHNCWAAPKTKLSIWINMSKYTKVGNINETYIHVF